MQKLECAICQTERERRNRLITDEDARLRKEPFCTAPYIHKNNQPKYHAMLLRAEEAAKRAGKYALWFSARDEPNNPAQVAKDPQKMEKRLQAFLQFHEQKTAGILGLNILYEGMRARVTEKIVKGRHIKILKHTPCTVIGWDLHAIDRKSIFG